MCAVFAGFGGGLLRGDLRNIWRMFFVVLLGMMAVFMVFIGRDEDVF